MLGRNMILMRCAVARLATVNKPKAFTHSKSYNGVRARSTLSKIWVPTGGVSATDRETGHGKLIRAGFLRQTQSGIFQLLPLGLRVQNKIEALLDKHMASIGASKLSLSTITSEEIWRRSGRLNQASSEFFRLADRKQFPMMLSPTHEEEITSLVASTLNSHKDLPLRLYQTTRKYRDEMRPRHGLLRSREFVMKDLYTFDKSFESAISTYRIVAGAYRNFFADLKLPILVAEASSGDMGGHHSHEYHLANPIGEDTVISCNTCGYTANDEVATTRPISSSSHTALSQHNVKAEEVRVWRGITRDRKTLVNAWYPAKGNARVETDINVHAVREVIADLDTSVNDPVEAWRTSWSCSMEDGSSNDIKIINLVDMRLASSFNTLEKDLPITPAGEQHLSKTAQPAVITSCNGNGLNLLRPMEGDGCPRCDDGQLRVHRALELGHTFYLGTRYSEPLDLSVMLPNSKSPTHVEMGCYGIGVSRIFGAVAEHKADRRGLQWPRAIAPFETVVIPTSGVTDATLDFYDKLASQSGSKYAFDAVLDDRKETFGWKMQDADLIGYPVTIVLGKAWREKGICEVQCRSLSIKDNVAVGELPDHLNSILSQL